MKKPLFIIGIALSLGVLFATAATQSAQKTLRAKDGSYEIKFNDAATEHFPNQPTKFKFIAQGNVSGYFKDQNLTFKMKRMEGVVAGSTLQRGKGTGAVNIVNKTAGRTVTINTNELDYTSATVLSDGPWDKIDVQGNVEVVDVMTEGGKSVRTISAKGSQGQIFLSTTDESGAAGGLKKGYLAGNVVITIKTPQVGNVSDVKTAKGDRLDFDFTKAEPTLELKGNVEVDDGINVLTGNEALVILDKDLNLIKTKMGPGKARLKLGEEQP